MATTSESASSRVSLQFSVGVPEACPLYGLEGEIVSTSRQMVDGGCHSIFVVRSTDAGVESVEMQHDRIQHGETCLCHVFCELGVLPIFDRVDVDRLLISAFLREETEARTLYEALRDLNQDIEIRRLHTTGDPCHMNSLTRVNLTELTVKQRTALELAVAEGYYEEPKQSTITELADSIGISRQAFSHRLKEAEREVFEQVVSDLH